MNQTADMLATLYVVTTSGTVLVSQEEIDAAGSLSKWLRGYELLGPFESDKHVPRSPGPILTRAAYEALPELD